MVFICRFFSKTVLATDIPAKPPPTTMDWSEGDAIGSEWTPDKRQNLGRSATYHDLSNTTEAGSGGECMYVVFCVCCVLSVVCCDLKTYPRQSQKALFYPKSYSKSPNNALEKSPNQRNTLHNPGRGSESPSFLFGLGEMSPSACRFTFFSSSQL